MIKKIKAHLRARRERKLKKWCIEQAVKSNGIQVVEEVAWIAKEFYRQINQVE